MTIRKLGIAVTLALGLVAAAGCGGATDEVAEAPAPAPAADARPSVPPPPVSVNASMVAFVDHAGHALWDVEREGMMPESDEDWFIIEEHATQLAASGNLLMLGGAGPNDLVWSRSQEWRDWARAMSDAGMAAITAARNKDFDALVVANGQLVESCEGCHREFKPDLPSEGLVHSHVH